MFPKLTTAKTLKPDLFAVCVVFLICWNTKVSYMFVVESRELHASQLLATMFHTDPLVAVSKDQKDKSLHSRLHFYHFLLPLPSLALLSVK